MLTGCKRNVQPETFDFSSIAATDNNKETGEDQETSSGNDYSDYSSDIREPSGLSISDIPSYSGDPYAVINGNEPFFELTSSTDAFEYYGDLDHYGRCTVASADLGQELMPKGKRGDISHIRPTGWIQSVYECVEGGSLYNRSHLIAYSLAGENDNERNLITGTRYMNAVSMQEFELMVLDYIRETGNHVLYRVTPVFNHDEPLARGVNMEAYSVEDEGDGIQFNVFCYNVQPDILLDYKTGDSMLDPDIKQSDIKHYVINTGSKKFHDPSCPNISDIKEGNRSDFTCTRDAITKQGYIPCNGCRP